MSQSRSSGKFNLLGKKSPKHSIQFGVYIKKDDKKYYLQDFDDETNTGWWTAVETAAFTFSDEEEVIDFCEMFLRNRKYNICEI